MNLRPRFFVRFKLLGLAALCVATLSAGTASARAEIIRWTHPDSGEVVSWEAHVGTSRGNYDQVIPLSNLQMDPGGVFQTSIEVADNATVYIALRAIGQSGQRSAISNERERVPSGSGGSVPAVPPAPPILIQVVPVEQP